MENFRVERSCLSDWDWFDRPRTFQVRSTARMQVCYEQWPRRVTLRYTSGVFEVTFILFGSLCMCAVVIDDWQTLLVCRILNELKWIPSHCLLLRLFLTTCGLVHCSVVEIWTVLISYCRASSSIVSVSYTLKDRETAVTFDFPQPLFFGGICQIFHVCAFVWCVLAPGHVIDLLP